MSRKSKFFALGLSAIMGLVSSINVAASNYENTPSRQKFYSGLMDEVVQRIMSYDAVVIAIREQNVRSAGLDEEDILRRDKKWRKETTAPEKGTLIKSVMESDASILLSELLQLNREVYSEIIVMDNRGLNVAVGEPTSDYWQGDEAKFQETFGMSKKNAVHVGNHETDQSSRRYQIQVSRTLLDPKTGEKIGAITVGLDSLQAIRLASDATAGRDLSKYLR